MKTFYKKEAHFKSRGGEGGSKKDVYTIFKFFDSHPPLSMPVYFLKTPLSYCPCGNIGIMAQPPLNIDTETDSQTLKHMHMPECILIQLPHSVTKIKSFTVQY